MFKKCILCFSVFILTVCSIFVPVFAESSDLELDSPSAILMDMDTGKVLYEKNIHNKMYPASISKVLTTIITLEKCNLDEVCTVSYDAVMGVEFGYVTANLQIGEELTVEQLLNLAMVSSSNDAALVLAEHVAGNIENFANLMNQKATELGCKNSHFTNPAGVHDDNHYSTAYDLAIIGKYAMQNSKFRELAKKTFYKLPQTNKYPNDDRIFTTTNELLVMNNNNRSDNYYFKYATGIKTGFTTPAGHCLMASSEKEGFNLISVVLGGNQTKDGLSARYVDTKKLFEFGYSNYSIKQVAKVNNVIQTVNIKNATKETKKLELIIDKDISVIISADKLNTMIYPKIELNPKLKAPIKKGTILGSVTYEADGLTYCANLLAKDDVKPSYKLIKFLVLFLIITIIIVFLKFKNKSFKNLKNNLMKN